MGLSDLLSIQQYIREAPLGCRHLRGRPLSDCRFCDGLLTSRGSASAGASAQARGKFSSHANFMRGTVSQRSAFVPQEPKSPQLKGGGQPKPARTFTPIFPDHSPYSVKDLQP
jgi:hypothetical protein